MGKKDYFGREGDNICLAMLSILKDRGRERRERQKEGQRVRERE